MLCFFPWLAVSVFLLPVAAGLAGTVLPAVGWFPALGRTSVDLSALRHLLEMPGLLTAVNVSLAVGFGSTVLALAVTVVLCAVAHGTPFFSRLKGLLAPMLAAPHAAVAIGLAFVIAPSGWLMRLVSPWLTGLTQPPDLRIIQDPYGLAMIAGLLLKAVPYLLFMTIGALGQTQAVRSMAVARSLGYGGASAWCKVVLPQVYPQIRLPVYALLAFSLSVVDVGLILGPSTPPPLAVYVYRLFLDRDPAMILPGAAGALLQLAVVVVALGVWRLGEIMAARLARGWLVSGGRGRGGRGGNAAVFGVAGAIWGVFGLGLAALVLWSVARSWWFPEALPSQWSLDAWRRALPELAWPLWNTVVVGVSSMAASLFLTVGCLENEARRGVRTARYTPWLLYAPLLVPQIAFMYGLQTLFVHLGLDGTLFAVILAHTLFVFPYVFLSLADPWRALDERYVRSALGLGASPMRAFGVVKLPLLLRPVAFAAAVGFAVSVSQYLPTIFAGAGRIPTLTTEAVTLASGGDRRVAAVFALAQAVLPFVVYVLALQMSGALRIRPAGGAGNMAAVRRILPQSSRSP